MPNRCLRIIQRLPIGKHVHSCGEHLQNWSRLAPRISTGAPWAFRREHRAGRLAAQEPADHLEALSPLGGRRPLAGEPATPSRE
jgi:hypothetical protein